jgi:hypothetical protein
MNEKESLGASGSKTNDEVFARALQEEFDRQYRLELGNLLMFLDIVRVFLCFTSIWILEELRREKDEKQRPKKDISSERGAKTEFGNLLASSPDREPSFEAGSALVPISSPTASTEPKNDVLSKVLPACCVGIRLIISGSHVLNIGKDVKSGPEIFNVEPMRPMDFSRFLDDIEKPEASSLLHIIRR